MKKSLLANVVKVWSAVKTGGRKSDPELGALDRGVLEVALMVAALDGEIMPAEYETFGMLAKTCRGYTQKNAKACLDGALRKAGYLMAMAQIGCYTPAMRVTRFVEMAAAALPNGFARGSQADVRRAFVLWFAMAAADGSVSPAERHAIEALRDHFTRVEAERRQLANARCEALNPAFPFSVSRKINVRKFTLLEDGFLPRAEELVQIMGETARLADAQTMFAAVIEAAVEL